MGGMITSIAGAAVATFAICCNCLAGIPGASAGAVGLVLGLIAKGQAAPDDADTHSKANIAIWVGIVAIVLGIVLSVVATLIGLGVSAVRAAQG